MTIKEQKIIGKTIELWNLIVDLQHHHPDDLMEHRRDIHNIQNRIAARNSFNVTNRKNYNIPDRDTNTSI